MLILESLLEKQEAAETSSEDTEVVAAIFVSSFHHEDKVLAEPFWSLPSRLLVVSLIV